MDLTTAKDYFEKFRYFVYEFVTGDIRGLADGSETDTFMLFLLEFPIKLTIITREEPSSIDIQLFASIERDENDEFTFSISPQPSLEVTGNLQHFKSVLESNERFLSTYTSCTASCLDLSGDDYKEAKSANKTIDLDFIYRLPFDKWEAVTYDQLFADVKKDLTLFYSVVFDELGVLPAKIKKFRKK